MNDSSALELRLLLQFRRGLEPSAEDQDRVGALLSRRIALGLAAAGAPAAFDPTPGAEGAARWTLGATGKQLVTGGVIAALGFGAGYQTALSRSSSAVAVPAVVPAHSARVVDPNPREAPILPQASAVPARSPDAPAPARAAAGPAASVAGTEQTLQEEALELRRVDRALRGSLPLLAIAILDDLDRRIPRGKLLEEREAARLMARCANGDEAGRHAAATWLERRPRSVYAPRLRRFCGAPARDGAEVGGAAPEHDVNLETTESGGPGNSR